MQNSKHLRIFMPLYYYYGCDKSQAHGSTQEYKPIERLLATSSQISIAWQSLSIVHTDKMQTDKKNVAILECHTNTHSMEESFLVYLKAVSHKPICQDFASLANYWMLL